MSITKHLQTKHSIAYFNLIRKCDGDELRFYLYVKLYAINKNSAYPSQKAFKRDLGWSKYTTSRIAKKMQKANRLKIDKEQGKNNSYDITWYDRNNKGSLETFTSSSLETLTTSSLETLTQTNTNITNIRKRDEKTTKTLPEDRKTSASSNTQKVIQSFYEQVYKYHKYKPEISRKDAGSVQRLLSRANDPYTPSELEKIISWYIKTPKYKDYPTLSSCLSAHSISLYKEKSKKSWQEK
jgi:hypothetical protein